MLVNSFFAKRLWSHQLAETWLSVLEWAKRLGIDEGTRYTIARELLYLAPEGETAPIAFSHLLADSNAPEPRLVSLIVSCRKRLRKAVELRRNLRGALGPTYIVSGDSTLQRAVIDDDFIVVPSPDNYESLTRKVFEAFVAVRGLFSAAAILKMDDDCRVLGELNLKAFWQTVGEADYVGQPAGSAQFDRTWHIGKCECLSPPVYGLRFHASWARGPLYYLSQRAVEILVKAYLSYPAEFAMAFYEDKCIGDTLVQHGFHLTPTPLWEATGLISGNERPADL
jgi:hypothetical protein